MLPTELMSCVFVPIVKNKGGDLSDINNYRAITISNALSKLFKACLLKHVAYVTTQTLINISLDLNQNTQLHCVLAF